VVFCLSGADCKVVVVVHVVVGCVVVGAAYKAVVAVVGAGCTAVVAVVGPGYKAVVAVVEADCKAVVVDMWVLTDQLGAGAVLVVVVV